MSVPEWPSELPQKPLIEDFSDTPRQTFKRSSFDGYTKSRNRFTAAINDVSERYLFTNEQFSIFEDFYRNELANGANVFLKLDPKTDTLAEYRFREVYSDEFLGRFWKISLELEKLP